MGARAAQAALAGSPGPAADAGEPERRWEGPERYLRVPEGRAKEFNNWKVADAAIPRGFGLMNQVAQVAAKHDTLV